jgi:uncharacterized membrane protein (DUF373 family)
MTRKWHLFSGDRPNLTVYQRFESGVALVLTLLIAMVILVALYRLLVQIVAGLVFGAMNPLDHEIFQSVFGEIMTLLIALEFNHTLQYVATRQQTIIQTKVVLLIALLALARKVIVLDLSKSNPWNLLGLASVTVALGMAFWLTREHDARSGQTPS